MLNRKRSRGGDGGRESACGLASSSTHDSAFGLRAPHAYRVAPELA
jgi:hypothetical protein